MNDGLLGFNGERPDPVSGVTHLGNGYRPYHPPLMRFNAPDSMSPFGHGGINPYAYCAGDPVNRADPSGHVSLGQWMGLGVGLMAGITLSIVTGGTALTVATALLADVAGGAAIGAGAELVTGAVDGQQVNWGQVGIAAGAGAAAALVGYGVGKASLLKGMANRPPAGGMMEGGGATPALSRARYLGTLGLTRDYEGSERFMSVLFEDTHQGYLRLNLWAMGDFSGRPGKIFLNGQVFGPAALDRRLDGGVVGNMFLDLQQYRSFRLLAGNTRQYVCHFARRLGMPVTGYRGCPQVTGAMAEDLRNFSRAALRHIPDDAWEATPDATVRFDHYFRLRQAEQNWLTPQVQGDAFSYRITNNSTILQRASGEPPSAWFLSGIM